MSKIEKFKIIFIKLGAILCILKWIEMKGSIL